MHVDWISFQLLEVTTIFQLPMQNGQNGQKKAELVKMTKMADLSSKNDRAGKKE